MEFELGTIVVSYRWQEALLALVGIIALTKIGKFIAFRVPAIAEARRINLEADKEKLAKPKYLPVVRASQKVGLAVNVVFFLLILPWIITLTAGMDDAAAFRRYPDGL